MSTDQRSSRELNDYEHDDLLGPEPPSPSGHPPSYAADALAALILKRQHLYEVWIVTVKNKALVFPSLADAKNRKLLDDEKEERKKRRKLLYDTWEAAVRRTVEYRGYDAGTENWYFRIDSNWRTVASHMKLLEDQLNRGVAFFTTTNPFKRTFKIRSDYDDWPQALRGILKPPLQWRKGEFAQALFSLRIAVAGHGVSEWTLSKWENGLRQTLNDTYKNHVFTDSANWEKLIGAVNKINKAEWRTARKIPSDFSVPTFIAHMHLRTADQVEPPEYSEALPHYSPRAHSLQHRRIGIRQARMRRLETLGQAKEGGVHF